MVGGEQLEIAAAIDLAIKPEFSFFLFFHSLCADKSWLLWVLNSDHNNLLSSLHDLDQLEDWKNKKRLSILDQTMYKSKFY